MKVPQSRDPMSALIRRIEALERNMATTANTYRGVPTHSHEEPALLGADAVSVRAAEPSLFTSTSTAWTLAGGPVLGVVFIAPESGRVLLGLNAECFNSTAASHTGVAPSVRTGNVLDAGMLVQAPAWETATLNQQATGGGIQRAAVVDVLEGLTPGDPYNVVLMHAVTSGTGSLNRRSVWVSPAR